MPRIDEAWVELTTRDKKFKKGMADANKSVKSFRETVKSTGKLLAAAFIGGAAINALRGFIELSRQQAREEAKLAAVIKATGSAAGKTSGELKKYASSLQDLTGIGDEVIIGAQALLATFKNIKGDTFDEATTAVLDMSQALGQDLKSSAIQLGKALNDPIKGVTALSRVGVSFTEEQKAMIKTMVEANDILGAQAVILRELQSEFGGAAKAMATDIDKLSASWGDLKEQIGGVAAEMGNSLINFKLLAEQLKAIRGGPKGVWEALYDRAAAYHAQRTGQTIITPKAGVAAPPAPVPSILPGGRGPISAAERRNIQNNMQNPGGPLFDTSGRDALRGRIGAGIGQAMGAFNSFSGSLPSSDEAQKAMALRKKINAMDTTKPDTSKFFGLSGFSRAIQESMGKPDEQKSRDEKRDVLLREERDLSTEILGQLKAGIVGVFGGRG